MWVKYLIIVISLLIVTTGKSQDFDIEKSGDII